MILHALVVATEAEGAAFRLAYPRLPLVPSSSPPNLRMVPLSLRRPWPSMLYPFLWVDSFLLLEELGSEQAHEVTSRKMGWGERPFLMRNSGREAGRAFSGHSHSPLGCMVSVCGCDAFGNAIGYDYLPTAPERLSLRVTRLHA